MAVSNSVLQTLLKYAWPLIVCQPVRRRIVLGHLNMLKKSTETAATVWAVTTVRQVADYTC